MWEVVAPSGGVADCTRQIVLMLTLPFQAWRRNYNGYNTCEQHKSPSLEPLFGLSTLGYCRKMVVQHGGLN